MGVEIESSPDFNSIKVQLKLVLLNCCDVIHTFQFHKGTIKTCIIGCTYHTTLFQFHKGTIKT